MLNLVLGLICNSIQKYSKVLKRGDMKLIKQASGKKKLKISKKEWTQIGKTAGWLDDNTYDMDGYDSLDANDDKKSEALKTYEKEKEGVRIKARNNAKKEALVVIDEIEKIDKNLPVEEFIEAIYFINGFGEYIVSAYLNNDAPSIHHVIREIKANLNTWLQKYTEKLEENIDYEYEIGTFEDFMSDLDDAAEEARDPYGYRGLSRSDF